MLKISKVLALVMLMVVSVGLPAQTNPLNKKKWGKSQARIKPAKEVKTFDEDYVQVVNDSTALLMGKAKDNWYVSLGTGFHMFSGNEKDRNARINPLTPHGSVKVGKWLSPCVGIQANFDMGYAKGKSQNNAYVYSPEGEYLPFKFTYYDLYGDFMLDFMNLIWGYERGLRKKWHVQGAIGLGYVWQTGKVINSYRKSRISNYELSFHAGFNNDFKVSERVLIYFEPKIALMRGSWDYSPGENTWGKMDMLASLSVGAKLNLGKRARHKFVYGSSVTQDEVTRLRKEISKLNRENKMAKQEKMRVMDSISRLISELRDQLPYPMQIMDIVEQEYLNYTTVYYRRGSYSIDYSTETSLKTFAGKINRTADDVKFFIISSADNSTGSPESNRKLTQNRCDAVYHVLVDKYGVSPKKLEICSLGGVEHYEPDELNRMTLVVESHSEIIRILNHFKDNQQE